MYFYPHSFATPEENLAWDEAMVEVADRVSIDATASVQHFVPTEVLRVWEMPSYCVILGRSSRVAEEVNFAACQAEGVPIYRRSSGGATVVAGPGCLMYSVLISYDQRPSWRQLDVAHRETMARIGAGVQATMDEVGFDVEIRMQGTCDLTIGDIKFSGNALRCKRHWMLYHGTLLYQFPIANIARWLLTPPRQPDYRRQRSHEQFVGNMPCPKESKPFTECLTRQLAIAWNTEGDWSESTWSEQTLAPKLEHEINLLCSSRYANRDWNLGR